MEREVALYKSINSLHKYKCIELKKKVDSKVLDIVELFSETGVFIREKNLKSRRLEDPIKCYISGLK